MASLEHILVTFGILPSLFPQSYGSIESSK